MKPLTKRQLEVLAAIRRIQASGNPLPDAAVRWWELRESTGNRGLQATVAVLKAWGLVEEVFNNVLEGPTSRQDVYIRTLRAIPAEDVA